MRLLLLPVLLLLFTGGGGWTVVAGLAAMIGLFIEDDLLVRAGQAIPIS